MHCKICSYCELDAVMHQGLVWKHQTWPASEKVRSPFQITQIVYVTLAKRYKLREEDNTSTSMPWCSTLTKRRNTLRENTKQKLLYYIHVLWHLHWLMSVHRTKFTQQCIHVATWKQWEQNSNKYWKHAAGMQARCEHLSQTHFREQKLMYLMK